MREAIHPGTGLRCREDGAIYVKDGGKSTTYHWSYGYTTSNGYKAIFRLRKHYSVHRLIAEAFLPNPDNKPTVDHINRDRTDNRLENLRWATHKEQNENCSAVLNRKYEIRACDDRQGYDKVYNKDYRQDNKEKIKQQKRDAYTKLSAEYREHDVIHHKCPDGKQRWHLRGHCPVCWVGSHVVPSPIYLEYVPENPKV